MMVHEQLWILMSSYKLNCQNIEVEIAYSIMRLLLDPNPKISNREIG